MNLNNPVSDVELFKAAVNVTPLWNEGTVDHTLQSATCVDTRTDSPLKPACEAEGNEREVDDPSENIPFKPHIQIITIVCPSRYTKRGPNTIGESLPIRQLSFGILIFYSRWKFLITVIVDVS